MECKIKTLGIECKIKTLGIECKIKTLGIECKIKTLGIECNFLPTSKSLEIMDVLKAEERNCLYKL
jgi:hypothetical protein